MKKLYLVATALAVISAPLTAQAFSPIGALGDGGQFWDNNSTDGTGCNVGYVLTGAAGANCQNQRPAGWLPYTGPVPGTYYNDGFGGWQPFSFMSTGVISLSHLSGEPSAPSGCCDIAGGDVEWGYWEGSHASRTPLNGSVLDFTIGHNFGSVWGVYMQMYDEPAGTYRYSDTDNQFALFQISPSRYIITFEDLRSGDYDYNDTYLQISADSGTPFEVVPEPATMTLLATGLAGMAAASRRRKAKK